MSKVTKTIAALGVVAGLGVAALPLASYADSPDSKPITINANIGSSFSLAVDKNSVTLTPTNNGPVVNTETDGGINATVISNNAAGYTLRLTGTEDYSLADGDNKIAAGTPAKGTSAWAVKGGKITGYQALGAPGLTLADTTVPTDIAGEVTDIDFAVSAAPNQAAGNYSATLTLTATAK